MPDIARIHSQLEYGARLRDTLYTEIATRLIAYIVTEFNSANYEKNGPLVFLNVEAVKFEDYQIGGSLCNYMKYMVAINLVDSLLDISVPGAAITILTQYQAQFRCNNSTLEKLAKSYPDAKNVISAKVYTYQGGENYLIILDLVAALRIGFLKRINIL